MLSSAMYQRDNNSIAKPAKRRVQTAAGTRFRQESAGYAWKNPKIAALAKSDPANKKLLQSVW